MAEKREIDEGQLIDQTLLLFQNAIAEAENVVPPAQGGRALDAKETPLSKRPEKRTASLIGDFVAFARTVAGFEPATAQTGSSSQRPVTKSASSETVENLRFDPLVGRARTNAPVFPIREPKVVGTAPAFSFDMFEAQTLPRQPPDRSTSRDAPHLDRPTQERPHAPFNQTHSTRVAKNAIGKPAGDERSDPRADRTLSMHATVAVDQPNVVEAISPRSLNTAEAAAARPPQLVYRLVSRNTPPLERPTQGKLPALIDLAHPPPVTKNAAKKLLGEERSDSPVDKPRSMVALAPIDEPNMVRATPPPSLKLAEPAAASIRQRVVEPASSALPLAHPNKEEPPVAIENAHSLVVKKVVISAQKAVLVKQLLVSELPAAQIGHSSLEPCAKQGPDKPILDAPSDPFVGQLSMLADEEPKLVETVPPLPANRPVAAELLRNPVDEPASRDILSLARLAQEGLPSLVDQALCLIKDVVISKSNTIPVEKLAVSEFEGISAAPPSLQPPVGKPALEKPAGASRFESLIDQAPSVIGLVPGGEPNVIEAASQLPLNTAGAEPLSLQQPTDRSASTEVPRSLERLAQEELPSIDRALPPVVEAAPTAPKTESAVSLPQQPIISQLSPEDRLDVELADIRKRVAAFKEHQQRVRREREQYYATTGKDSGQPG